jgi:hypothetical protein
MGETTQLLCKSCGANIDIIPGVTKYICPYCETENYLFDSQAPPEQPKDIKHLIYIKAQPKQLRSLLLSKMIEHDLAPDDILTASVIQEETIMYVPCYVTSGSFDLNWTASFGYDRQESYVDYETYTENGRTRTRPVTRYRTVTDWRPVNGKAHGNFLATAYAGSNISKEAKNIVESLPTSYLTPYTPAFVSGYDIEPFSKNPADVQGTFDYSIRRQEYAAVASHFQGDRQRDVNYNSKRKTDFTETGLLPLAHAVFSYKEGQYNLWADGYDMSRIYCDVFPHDKSRQSKISRGYIPVVLAIVALVVVSFLYEEFNPYTLFGPLAGVVYYYLRKSGILNYSKRIRESTLAKKKLEDVDQVSHLSREELARLQKSTTVGSVPLFGNTAIDSFMLPFLSLLFVAGVILLFFLAD